MDIDRNFRAAGIRRSRSRVAAIGVGAFALLAFAVAPGLAQKAPPPPPPSNAFADGYEICMQAAMDLTAVQALLTNAGFTMDEPIVEGPFQHTVSATKIDDVNGDAYFYVVVETYPTLELTYCTYEIEGVVGEVDFAAATDAFGLDGGVELGEGGVYGAWEMLGDEGGALILAQQEGDYFLFQVNFHALVGEDAAPAVTAAPPGK